VERIDSRRIGAVAAVSDGLLDAIAARRVESLEAEGPEIDPPDRPVIQVLSGRPSGFCRDAR
jgi:hypothetical protein